MRRPDPSTILALLLGLAGSLSLGGGPGGDGAPEARAGRGPIREDSNGPAGDATTVQAGADLAVVQTDLPDPVVAGTVLTYVVTVTNDGPDDARKVVVVDTLPAGARLVSTSGCAEDPAGSPTCALGTIAAPGSREITYRVEIDPATSGTISNTARVTATTPDPVSSNNVATEMTAVVGEADLAITKTAAPDPAALGAELIYTITVTNHGPSDARSVTVADVLSAELTLVSTSGCAEDPAGAPACSLGRINVSGEARFTIVSTVARTATGPVTNTATATSAIADPDLANNSATAVTPVDPPPVADAGPDRRGTPASTIILDGSGSSGPGGGDLTYAWSHVAGPDAPLDDPAAARPVVDVSQVLPGSLITYQLIVDDGAASSAPDFVNVQVVPFPDWHRWRRDSRNTGSTPSAGPIAGGSSLSITFPDGVRSSVSFGLQGGMYVGNDDGSLYALDLDGTVRWTFPTGGPVRTTPLVPGDGRVYFGSFDGRLYAVSESTGELVWSHAAAAGSLFRFSSPVILPEVPGEGPGRVIAGTSSGELVALDTVDGMQVWSFPAGGPIYSSPAVLDGTVLFGSNDGHVRAVNAADGSLVWATSIGSAVQSGVSVDAGMGYAFFGTDDGRVIAVNAASGQVRWEFAAGAAVTSSPAVDAANGRIYVGSDDHGVHALDESTGRELWRFQTGAEVRSSPTVASGPEGSSLVYVGACDGNLYALDGGDGSLVFTFPLSSGVIIASPTVSNDGLVYLGSTNRFLYVIGPDPFAGGIESRAPRVDALSPSTLAQGASAEILVQGRDLSADTSIDLGTGVRVVSMETMPDDRLRLQVSIDAGAPVGPRDVAARRADGLRSTALSGFDVAYDCRRSDLTGDEQVDGLDLATLAARFGTSGAVGSPTDLDGDGRIDGTDLALLAASFGRPPCR